MQIGQQRVVHFVGDGENEDHMPIVRRGPATGRGPARGTGRILDGTAG
jgi:hypothetical protein